LLRTRRALLEMIDRQLTLREHDIERDHREQREDRGRGSEEHVPAPPTQPTT
jgi:hypothetical protein